ncbi:MAG: hypothetical protein ACPG4W_05635 [Flavobacteriales bacterium]
MYKNILKTLLFCAFLGFSFGSLAQNKIDDQGLKQGKWSKKYPNGQLRYSGQFVNDLEVDTFSFYDKSGRLVSTRIYETAGGKALVKMYNVFGNLHAQGYVEEKQKQGEWLFFADNGTDTLSIEFYKDHELDGKQRYFFENGQLAGFVNCVNGVKEGEFVDYFENGQIQTKGSYKSGLMEGDIVFYYKTGELKRKGQYKSGNQSGVWNEYNPDGSLKLSTDHDKE